MCYRMRLFTRTRQSEIFYADWIQKDKSSRNVDSEEKFLMESVLHTNKMKTVRYSDYSKGRSKIKKNKYLQQQQKSHKWCRGPHMQRQNLCIFYSSEGHAELAPPPCAKRMEKTLQILFYWPNMSKNIKWLCTMCCLYQMSKRLKDKYGKLPPKDF